MLALRRAALGSIDQFSVLVDHGGKVAGLVDFPQVDRPLGTGGFQVPPQGEVAGGIGAGNSDVNVGITMEVTRLGDGTEQVNGLNLGIVGQKLGNGSDRGGSRLLTAVFLGGVLFLLPTVEGVAAFLQVDRHGF